MEAFAPQRRPRPHVPAWERRLAGFVVRRLLLPHRRGGPWPIPAHLPNDPVQFEGNSSARIQGRYFALDPSHREARDVLDAQGLPQPRGVVVCAHPDRRYASHWFVKQGWVEWLRTHGFEVLAFDFPMYGQSRGHAYYYGEDVLAAASFAARWSGGLPVHVVGLSMGAFAIATAAPWLDRVHSAVLESPYPTFADWYGDGWGRTVSKACERLFPRSQASFDAPALIQDARIGRILVAASSADAVTPVELSRRVADAAPADRTRFLVVDEVPHLELFSSQAYRDAILDTLGVPRPTNTVVGARAYTRPGSHVDRRSSELALVQDLG